MFQVRARRREDFETGKAVGDRVGRDWKSICFLLPVLLVTETEREQ